MPTKYFIIVSLLLLLLPAPVHAQEYSPNQLIIQFHPGQTPEDIQAMAEEQQEASSFTDYLQDRFQELSARIQGRELPQQALERVQNVKASTHTQSLRSLAPPNTSQRQSLPIRLVTFDPSQSIDQVRATYATLPEVNTVEYNYKFTVDRVPNDTYYSDQWHLRRIGLENSWDITTGSSQVTVAVIDTGIEANHPDLPSSRILAGYDFINADTDPSDDHGHGTFVSGIIGATTNNASGISGVNWQVKLLPYKVLDANAQGYSSDIIAAVQAATSYPADVINLSLGVAAPCNYLPSLQSAINTAYQSGITIIAAAGNDNTNAASYSPVSCQNTLGVGATDDLNQRAPYSNYGSVVDIAAPGADGADNNASSWIISTWTGGQIYGGIGTSYAAPHVAGAAALLKARYPTLSSSDIHSRLVSTATTMNQNIGPLLNVYAALQSTNPTPTQSPTPSPTLIPSPTPGSFGLSIDPTQVEVSIQPGGRAYALTLTSQHSYQFSFLGYPTDYGPGINWSSASGGISPGNHTEVDISVNANVPLSTYQGTARLRDDSGTEMTFPVTVHVTDIPSPTPAGSTGDIDGNGTVDIYDLFPLIQNFNSQGSDLPEDLNTNNIVDLFDFNLLMRQLGQ